MSRHIALKAGQMVNFIFLINLAFEIQVDTIRQTISNCYVNIVLRIKFIFELNYKLPLGF